jgi:hypothetical protein
VAAHTPSAEEALHTPSEAAEARTQAEEPRCHIPLGQQQQQQAQAHTRTQADRSSSSRVARGGVLCGSVCGRGRCCCGGGGHDGSRRGKTNCGGGGCDARGLSEDGSEGVSADANVTMMSMMKSDVFVFAFAASRDLLLL